MKNSKLFIRLSLLIITTLLSIESNKLSAQCPNIQVVDLRETAGFPQTDVLNVCGDPDTLSLLIFTDDPGDIQGFELTVNMVSGMRYAGFQETHFGGCTDISNSDPSLQSPVFIAGGITCGDIYVANIGITADCSVDLNNNDYFVETEFEYTYFPPTGGFANCTGTVQLDNDFNGAIRESVLNMFTPSPIDVTVTSLGTPSCQTFVVSQNGLQASLDEFQFSVCGLDLASTSTISVSSMTANGIDILGGATYDAVTSELSTTINSTIFPTNASPNPFGEPDQFDTNEEITFEICYDVANCPEGADLPFSYKASYGCFDELCQQTGQSSFLRVRPTGSLLPTITASLENGITICGDDAKVSANVTNPNTDTDQNVYTDLHIGFQACAMEAFNITDVMINGVSVPPVFMIVGDDIDIDLSMNTNPGIGLVDYDGDGFFDDLPGGAAPLDIMVMFSLACGVGSDGGCPEINCENVQFYVSGKTNCGNNFQGFPPTGGFDLQYGQEDAFNVGEVNFNAEGTVVGYDFGTYSNDGAPLGATNSSMIEVEFCYEFAQTNIEDCPSGGETFFRAKIGGPDFVTNDLDYVPGTAMIDDGSGYVAVPDANVSLTTPMAGMKILEIAEGNNNSTLCYKYSLILDECHCGPIQYMAVDQQIVSVCSDCTPDCEIVKGCNSTLFAANPECTDCPCMAQYTPVLTERKNLGYTDKSMTTKITRDELLAANAVDLNRFMPGDTLWHQGFWELLDEDMLFMDPMRWLFAFQGATLTGSATSGEVQAALPLTWEGGSITLNEMRIENPDGTIHIVDMSTLAECATDPTASVPTVNSFNSHFEMPWGDDPNNEGAACATGSWEGFDNDFAIFDMWNFTRMEEVFNASGLGTTHVRGTGDCATEFIETYELVVGSKIHFDWCVPLIKNPLREMAKIIGAEPPEQNIARLVPSFSVNHADEIAGNTFFGWGPPNIGCVEVSTYQIDCPGGIKTETNIVLDNCGGSITHEIVVDQFAGPPGDEWFTHEYKPLIELHDLELPIYSPLAYCANAMVEQNGVMTPVTVDSTINMSCSPVGGYSDELCSVDVGGTGAIVIDLFDQGITGLGIGLDNCDTIKLSYDYCMICPAPLEGILDYEVKADWCYIGGLPTECHISNSTYFNPGNSGGPTTLGDEANAAGFIGVNWHNQNYYNIFNLDTLYCKLDDTQGVVFIDDSGVIPMAPVSATNADGSDLIASDAPGSSIEVKQIEFCNPDPMDATGFSGYVTVPSSVAFQGVCFDAAGTMEAVTALISDDGQTQKYQVDFPSDVLSPGDCISVFVKTTLLFCPAPGSLPPEICVGASSGCSPAEVRAAIGGGGSCSSSEVCYAYIFGEADLQTEWFSFPESIDLCETFTLHVRTGNVMDLLLLNIDPSFTLPFGTTVVPGSWEVAYPGGSVGMAGNFGPWTGVPDPDIVNGFDYSWSDDALWSSFIDMNGLVGVSAALDSNNVSFRFQVTTNCDEFLSGSRPSTESQASDPCGPEPLSSGVVEAPALIVTGADPADHAQLLTIASPADLFCGGLTNTFGLSALNISEFPTTDSVVTCITIPTDVLEYTPGSVMFTNGFVPDYVTETLIGNNLQVCVHSPVIPVGGSWTLTFEAEMMEDAPCGDIEIGANIQSVVESVSCVPGPPDECDVFVQNSINPSIFVTLNPPLSTDDVRVNMDCSAGNDPVQVCYEIDLSNPGPAYSGNVNVAIFDDVTANGSVDSFDGVLNDNDHAVSLAHGEMTTITMCLDVAAIQSCPIIVRQTFETDCACDVNDTPIMNLLPSWFDELEDCTVLCPTQPLMLEACGDYELSFDPVGGATMVDDGMGNLTIEIVEGFGIDAPVNMNLTGGTGECAVMGTIQLKSLGDYIPEDQVADICADDCVDLDLMIPSEYEDGATITWTPSIGLDDPTSATPRACDLTADQVYNVEIAFGEACVFNIEYVVNFNPNGVTTITGEEFCLCQEAGTLTGPAGFSSYEWYSIQSGAEILEFIGTTNTWNGPTDPGDYFLRAFLGGAICPNVSNIITLEGNECVDLELEKSIINIPEPLVLGSQITYEIVVCNIADDAAGLKFDATNVEISDELPGAVTYVQHTQTSGNYSPTTNQWDISTLASGTCETLLIDVTIDEVGLIENTAQISGSDQEDIDSEENNDDGDQSEDDEDAAVIELVCESLGGEIFYDNDNNGCQDPGEGLVMEAVNVSVYECGDVPGVDPPAAVTQTTDGEYEFGPDSDNPGADVCLDPMTEYFVVFNIPNGENEALEDYEFSNPRAASVECVADGENTEVKPNTGDTQCYDPSGDDDDNHIDAGITPPCYEMAGEIFLDEDNNGCQDPGEGLVMEDVEVSLYECGDVPGVDQPAASTIVSDGQYEFGMDSDDPGADICLENNTEYFVVFDIPNGVGEPLEDFEFSSNNASGACAVSGESDNVDPATGASGCFDPDDDDGSDGDDDQNVDAGITPPCEDISGEIFYDSNGNGCEDGTESLVMEPINVMLFECGDVPGIDPPAASTTVSDGEYEFGPDSEDPGAEICLEPGTEYFVVFDIPMGAGEVLDGYAFTDGTASPSCESVGESNDVNPSTGASDCVDPNDDDGGDGDDDNNVDAGIMPPCESLGGEIFFDYDDDGCQDTDEMLVNIDINVSLYECGDTPGVDPPAAATTVSDGEYMFGEGTDDPGADICLEAGTEYFVVFDIPNATGEALEDYEFSTGTADPTCALSGDSDDVDPTTGASGCFDPDNDDGDGDDNIDAGITPPCESLGGEIFYDDNMDGCEDSNESLVTEVIGVMLYECGDTPGVDPPAASTFTNDGMYEFGPDSDDPGADICLMPGTQYFVVFDIPNGAGEALDGSMITMGMADAGCEALGESNDVDPATGASGCFDPNDNDGDDGDSDNNIDAGISPPCESLSGEIFYDENRDGCEDIDEPLVDDADINVTLYECGDIPGVSPPVASTTVSDGMYEFGLDSDDDGADVCLDPNTEYFVVFDIPNATGEALEDYSFTEGEDSPGCAADGDSDDTDPATGATACTDPGSDGSDDVDAGITPPCESLGGEIFYDGNDDGCQDANEMLVDQPINVTLYECGDVPGVDPPAASTTVSDGMYEFGENSDDPGADICLEPDTEYFVVFDIPNAIGEALEEYEFSSGMADAACAAAGDSDDVNPATGASECHNPSDDDASDGDSDNNIDAGITPPCEQISGEIFYDLDENGCQDMGESLVLEDINVSLYECGDDPAVDLPVASTTVSDGMYAFGETSDDAGADVCLEPGTEYFVVFDIPMAPGDPLEGFEFTMAPLNPSCAAAGESDDVDPATGTSACYDPNNDDGEDGDADENVDAGIVPPCEEIAGEIFIDENNNGCEDPGESLAMTNITVSLYECGDVPGVDLPTAITTVTDGMYEFGEDSDDPGADICLAPNVEYFVVFDLPNDDGESLEDFTFSEPEADTTCVALGESDDVDSTTGSSDCTDPSGDDDDGNIDAGIVPPCESLSGEIFVDENRDGCEDPGESLALFDIEVSLYECGDVPGVDQPLASTTVSDGEYEFGVDSDDPGADVCLEAGTEYFVAFDLPNGIGEAAEDFEFTEGVASGACALSGESDNVDPATGTSGCFDPDDDDAGDGDDDENIDAGISPPCESLGGEIFYDDNANGCQDGGESLVMESINVMLFECGDLPGVDPPAASTSISDGMYEFGIDSDDPGANVCLEAGTEYFVVFDIPMGANEVLDGYEFSDGMASSTCMGAGQSNDVDPINGQSGCYDPNDDDGGDGNGDNNIDAGITPPCENIAGEIFFDDNADGCQDGTESLVMEDINVTLYECGDTPGVDQPVASTTVSDGMYEFGEDSDDAGADVCLEAGTEYFVVFDIPNAAGESLENFDFTEGEASGACSTSGDSDDVDSTTGASGCVDPDDNDGGDGDDDQNVDAGIAQMCESIAGEIFFDDNADGCQDGTESLVMEDINVTLYECGDTPGIDQPVASTTVSDGEYEFGIDSDDAGADVCLEAGTEYFVVFDIPNAAGESLENFDFTEGEASGACATSGDSDNVDPTNGQSGCVDPDDNDGGDGDDDQNVDAGITQMCESISGEIFYDTNGNGCEDSTESLVMEDINVSLYECGDTPGIDQPAASTTVSDGEYEFGIDSDDLGADICLEAGTEYFVVFDIPNGVGETLEDYAFTDAVASGDCATSGESDDIDSTTGASGCVDPDDNDGGDGDDDNNVDAGIMAPCESLSGEIFYDDNANGCQDGSEDLVMEAINVTLYECGATPGVDAPVASTSINDGEYMFGIGSDDPGAEVCLEAGTEYFVSFDIPMGAGEVLDGFEFTEGTASPSCESAGGSDDVDPTTGTSACFDPNNDDGTDGGSDENVDAGITPPCESIAGEIFFDMDEDGCQDSNESLVMEDIGVSLYECGDTPGLDQPVASTTVSDGEYEFGVDSDDPGADVCLEAGTEYFVAFDIPMGAGEVLDGFEFTPGEASGACSVAGDSDDVDPVTGTSACHDPDDNDSGDGNSDQNIDAGITAPCASLSGEIFYDNNGDGCQGKGDELVPKAVNVTLYECGDTPGVDDPVATAFTDDGMYEFGEDSDNPGGDVCLTPGVEYFVVFDIPNGPGEPLEGFCFGDADGDATCEALGDNNDVDATGTSECGEASENVDAGLVPKCEQIAGEIFYDDNNNGCQDPNEPLVDDQTIEVVLYQCGDVPGLDQPAAFTSVTDGQYVFGMSSDDPGANICLEAGDEYFVMFHIPNGPGEALEDYYFSERIASPGCLFSGEGDNIDNITGMSSCHDPSNDDSGDGDADENIDAGIMHPCEILGGEIFFDYDNDGCHDADESLITEAVNVTIFQCGDDPATATPVSSLTTTDGTYQFGDQYSVDYTDDPCLNPRFEYFVVFDFNDAVGDPLEDHYFSDGEDASCQGGPDSDDVHPDTGVSACYDPDNDDDDRNIDAGITPCEEISGMVYYDWNTNGCQDDASETPVEGVDVFIFECGEANPNASNALASAVTDIDGQYKFGPEEDGTSEVCLHPDIEYFVLFDIPNGDGELHEDFFVTDGDSATCAGGEASDNTDPTAATSVCLDPDDDDDDDDVNAGITPCEEIGGEVFFDNNRDGCRDDATEGPAVGVNVYVFECGTTNTSPSNALASDSTNADGEFSFGPEDEGDANVCLDPEKSYFVVYDIPNATGESLDHFALTDGDGVACAGGINNTDASPSTETSGCFDPDDDDDDEHINAGLMPCEELAGEVFFDDDADGCREEGVEQGVPGVDVYIFECGTTDTSPANALASTTTDDDGQYKFGSGEEGNADICLDATLEYFVLFDLPNDEGESLDSYEFTDGDSSTCAGADNSDNIDPTTGVSGCYDPSGDENPNAGVMSPVDIALTKSIVTPGPYRYEDSYTFNIEVFNEGELDLFNIKVNDFLPCGYRYLASNNGTWTFNPITEIATTIIPGPLVANTSQIVQITLELVPCTSPDAYTNVAEVESMENANGNDVTDNDVDSQGDADPNNDNGEDDADMVSIDVFDLALIKEIVTEPLYTEGDVIEFAITVVNQGNVAAHNIQVVDYLPIGYSFNPALNIGWDDSAAPSYFHTISGVLAPNDTVSVSFFATVEFVQQLQENYTNASEISGATDADGNTVVDADSNPDSNPNNDGTPVDDQFNDRGDEDDHDTESIELTSEFIPSCSSDCEIQCIGQINVSLDSMCMAVINPSTVGIGISTSCNDFYLTPTGNGLIVYDEFGNAIPGRKLGIDQIGQNLTYQLTEPTCGNRCWGNLLVEYKLPPQIECPDDLTLTCAEADDLGLPRATGGCLELTFDVLLVNEVTERLDCDTLYTQRITRTYRAEDELGNFIECSHQILVERVDLTQVVFPDNAVISCSEPGFLFLPNGAPVPYISNVFPTGSGSAGVPVLLGSMTGSAPLIPVGGATIVDSLGNITIVEGNANQLCNSAIVFTDVELPGTGCRRKFLRTFEVREWWCSGENVVGSIQQIEIVDDVAPELTCPADFTVTTNDDCAGSVVLPPAIASDICGDNGVIVRIEHPNGLIRDNGGEAMLEVGLNQIRYIASDSCFNDTTCVVNVMVEDRTEPIAICEQNTVVGISQSGSSFVFADGLDDGSFDECGLDRFEVARLEPSCVALDTLFDEKVAFCCTDVGQEVMVLFRAIDKAGNHNDCMVRVEVQDKQVPLVDCPDDQTVDCRLAIDLNNLGVLFEGPNLTDNCPSTQNIVENVTDDLNQCGIGTITRKLQLLDTDGTTILRQCTQIIEVINEAPFVETNIQWPLAIDTIGACDVAGLNPEDLPTGFGFPTFTSGDDQCSLLGFDFVDEVFTAANGTGECARIERTWTVINWCDDSSGSFAQFTDPNGPQIITIINTVAPTIDPQGPVLVQSSNIDCTSGDIAINRTAMDDCMNALSWTYLIRDLQGNTVIAGTGPSILTTLPAGRYTVTWNVTDFCGNSDSDIQDLDVQNTKSPTPICINGLSGMLVGDDSTGDGMIDRQIFELWATDVDGGSFHTCNNDIVVSLSPDPGDVNIVFDCDSIGIRPIRLYVTDMVTGVQDFCSTFINVQNNGQCGMTSMLLAVEGEVMTENLETVEDVEVELGNTGIMDMTEEDGQYAFQDMPIGGSYAVIPNKDIDYLNGVSTLDIIVIQRHILGVEELDSGYKLIAADVNGSENITAIDLIELRKLILGVYDELPNNTSWKFVDASHSFVDPLNPWATVIPEMYLINNLTMNMKIDFVGVKIGDVNGSVIANAQSSEIEKRASRSDVVLDITPVNNTNSNITRAEVRSGNYGKVKGLQGTVEFNADEIEVIGIEGRSIELNETNYNMRHQAKGWITLSYDGIPQNTEQNDDVLFEIIYKEKSTDVSAEPFKMTSKVTKTEAYVSGDQIIDVRMSYEVDESIAIVSVSPNPWIERATIEFNIPQAGNGQWEFYDVNGKVLHRMQGEYETGKNTIVLERKDIGNVSGIVYVKLTTKTSITNYKMMLVD